MEKVMDGVFEEMLVKSALRDRKIPIIEEFTRESCYKVMYYMNKIKDEDKRLGVKDEDKVIQIDISSYGGCAYSCLGLIGLIEQFKEEGYKIITNVQTFAMSAGFFLSIVGSERRMNRYGVLMAHQVLSGAMGELQRMKEDMDETERIWNVLKKIVMKYTKFTEEDLDNIRMRKLDLFIDSDMALEKGCADIIY